MGVTGDKVDDMSGVIGDMMGLTGNLIVVTGVIA